MGAAIVDGVDHEAVMATIAEESGWSPRYAFMILMSAGIAVLGLLVSSPAVVIGAMLISPLMNPILSVGFSLATFDFSEVRRSLGALAAGSVLAVAFTALIVAASPLKEATNEILSRTRPNLFDLLVALFAALAGAYAIIKGRGATIVGAAIATALMPPLAVVGYGLATSNMPVFTGSLALFVTNFVTIALSATIMARLYGFGRALSGKQSWIQSILVIVVFIGLAVPLGFSLSRIAREAVIVGEVRGFLASRFGGQARITHLAVDFDAEPMTVHAVVIAPRSKSSSEALLRTGLQKRLGRPLELQIDQVLLSRTADSLDAQRAQLAAVGHAAAAARLDGDRAAAATALAAGVPIDAVTLDRDHRRALAVAAALPGADLAIYRSLEERASAASSGWSIAIVPPVMKLPSIRFASGSDRLDRVARQAILLSAWAAVRWRFQALGVPGLRASGLAPTRLPLSQRRALAIAALLRAAGVTPAPAPPAGRCFRLTLAYPVST